MAGDSKKANDTGKNLEADTDKKNSETVVKKKQRGIFSRIWNRLFGYREDDFEKRLQHISKEEVSLVARMKKRSQSLRKLIRNLIIFSVIFEVIAVVYAIMTTRSVDLDWKTRASHVLPMFLLPALSSLAYSGLLSFSRIFDRKNQKTLERLRAERQAKIDELKEKTNYYITQQLIQKYDTDPAAKAAAATILASKLGADSGLKLHVGDESNIHEIAPTQSDGLRNRKQSHTKPASTGTMEQTNEQFVENSEISEISEISDPNIYTNNNNQLVVGHYQPGLNTNDGGWIARFAALLVGEDPTQSYALICGNCHMHNGLARKEDFPFITYYCPHCNALNKSQQLDGSPDSNIGNVSSSINPKLSNPVRPDSGASNEKVSPSSSPITALAETEENKGVSLEDSKMVG